MAGRSHTRLRTGPIIAVIVAAIVGGIVGGLIVDATSSEDDGSSGSGAGAAACSATTIAERDLRSVVTIKAHGNSGGGTGSGSIIDSDGDVLTNNHVIASAAHGGHVEVVFNDGEAAAATIVGRDPMTDLAVVRVGDPKELRPITLGAGASVAIGAPVVALGAPLGLSNTVTGGIVSALDRTITVPGESQLETALLVDAIQTDAAINPGNSGGALVNCEGELIGVPTAGATVPNASGEPSAGSVGINFAVPIDLAKLVADEIVETGKAEHAYIGIQTNLVQGPDGTPGGLQIAAIDPTGPAAEAGLQSGDVITKVDGEAATSNDQLLAITLKKRAGSTFEVEYERGGASHTATVTLGSNPSSGASA
ncbi:MAG: trypsin-like peptidase domain-containing protein [Solirubrobacterales bacterium]